MHPHGGVCACVFCLAAVRVGLIDGKLCLNPTMKEVHVHVHVYTLLYMCHKKPHHERGIYMYILYTVYTVHVYTCMCHKKGCLCSSSYMFVCVSCLQLGSSTLDLIVASTESDIGKLLCKIL